MGYAAVLGVWAYPPREIASSMECKSCIPGGKKGEFCVLSCELHSDSWEQRGKRQCCENVSSVVANGSSVQHHVCFCYELKWH